MLGRGTWKAVAKLPISACAQNEQANFAALRFTNHDYRQQSCRIVALFHESLVKLNWPTQA